MNQELYSYLQQLHIFIEAQERRIQFLEKKVMDLEKQTNELKLRPPIHVDNIEYKFDQLKVETLEGTLNIGLNPSDMQNIEDFAVNNQGIQTPFQPKAQFLRSMEIEDAIYKYMEGDLVKYIEETAQTKNKPIDESYIAFIKDDIKKQLPSRIDFYLKELHNNSANRDGNVSTDIHEKILESLKTEIQNGVQIFIGNLPENMKGMDNE